MTRATPARQAACKAIARVRASSAFVRDILPGILDAHPMSAEDRAFATRLAIGCVQASGTLDEVLDRAMRTPADAKPAVRDALKVGAYEMLFLGHEPYVAVDQGVELVAGIAPRARGLANAVLRKVADTAPAFPFGDPDADIGAAARLCGFPEWLAHELQTWMGPAEARRFMQVSGEQPPVFACVNALRISDAEAAGALRSVGVGCARIEDVDQVPAPGCIKLADAADIAHPLVKELIAAGSLIVSDAAAQAVAAIAAGHAGASFLDACAGRGTKALLIQSDAQRANGAQVSAYVALDNVASKRGALLAHADACGARISAAITGDACDLAAAVGDALFDAVLVDAPCTGLGTLRRHPEIRWRIAPEDIETAAALDARLLASAAERVRTGGHLIYATCTITPQENQGAIEAFLATPDGAAFTLVPFGDAPFFAPALTSGGCDAHFCAVMRKEAAPAR